MADDRKEKIEKEEVSKESVELNQEKISENKEQPQQNEKKPVQERISLKEKLVRIFYTVLPFFVVSVIATIVWPEQVLGFLSFLRRKIFQSSLAIAPFAIIGGLTYSLFFFPGRRLEHAKKKLFSSLGKTFAFFFIIMGSIRGLVYWGVNNNLLVELEEGLFTVLPFLLLSVIARYFFNLLIFKLKGTKRNLFITLKSISSVIIIGCGVLTAANDMGYDIKVLLGTLGVSGLALSFAVKDALSNSICGLLIIIYEPFKVGSRVKITDKEGIVEKIELKYLTLRESDEQIHIIPNSTVFKQIISINKKS